MATLDILVGADPEVFMRKGGVFQSAHGVIVGDKANPQKVNKGAVQVDGLALEFNIDPAKNSEEFADNITTVMGILQGMVPDFELVPTPVAEFTEEHMKAQPPEALVLGCEPDFNAWNDGAVNPRPNGDVNFRTGAGHVHIGWGKDFDINSPGHLTACIMLTKQLDYYLGLGSLVYDNDTKRRTMYGAAGAFRPKPYGVEYRVLSNAWLQSKDLMKWVFDCTKKAVDDLMEGERAFEVYPDFAPHVLKLEKPDLGNISHVMQQFKLPAPPGFRYAEGNTFSGFVKV